MTHESEATGPSRGDEVAAGLGLTSSIKSIAAVCCIEESTIESPLPRLTPVS
jgi:hypothetical protein